MKARIRAGIAIALGTLPGVTVYALMFGPHFLLELITYMLVGAAITAMCFGTAFLAYVALGELGLR